MTTPVGFSSFYDRDSIKNQHNVRVGDINLGVQTSPQKDFNKSQGTKPNAIRKSNITYSRIKASNDHAPDVFSNNQRVYEDFDKVAAQQPSSSSSQGSTLKIVLIVLGILVLIGLGAAAFYFFYYKKHYKPDAIKIPVGPGYDQATAFSSDALKRMNNIFHKNHHHFIKEAKVHRHHFTYQQ